MHEWDKALAAYERQYERNPDDDNYLLGRMRCLEALGEWLIDWNNYEVIPVVAAQ